MDILSKQQASKNHDNTRTQKRIRTRQRVGLAIVGLIPVVSLAWIGCSDDEPAGSGRVDPGGTFGAEVTVTVIGPGRVKGSLPGVDCPTRCFAKYIFESARADGATSTIGLKATASRGAKFKGWTFSSEPIGTQGRGPDKCNPVLRAGTDPGVDKSAAEIELPYGETTGTPPAGQEGPCGGYTKVPVVYNVTATFETEPVVDSGVDPGVVVYESPVGGTSARDMGVTSNGYLYWHFQTSGGLSGIAVGTTPTGTAPQTALTALSAGTAFSRFEVDPYGVLFQMTDGTAGVLAGGATTPTTLGSAPTCTAMAIDSSYNVYCRTSSTIVKWTYPNYGDPPTTLYSSGVPAGDDLAIASSAGPLYFSSGDSIWSLAAAGGGGAASPTPAVTGTRTNPTNLEPTSIGHFWIESNGVEQTVWASVGSTAYNTNIPATAGLRHLARDLNDSSYYYWAASSTAIYRAYALGQETTPTFSNLSDIGGIGADSTNLYWSSTTDGRIYRAAIPSL